MQFIKQGVRLISSQTFNASISNCLSGTLKPLYTIPTHNIHVSACVQKIKFLDHNKTIFPPQKLGEERRPGYVCHVKENIKYSPVKMWYIACFVRGMTVDEAVKQLSFLHKKGAAIVKDVILEAQKQAVEKHNIEYKSRMRRHARSRVGEVRYKYCHYFVRLEEGKPPKDYYLRDPGTGEQMLQEWMDKMNRRKVFGSL
nr:39S ribosomal protein L22, mitochondrial [Nomia melanderi]